MGADWSARLVVGVSLSVHPHKEERTKYNEDTGEPHKVFVDNSHLRIKDTGIVIVDDTMDDYLIKTCNIDEHPSVLGIEIAEADQCEGANEVGKAAMDEAYRQARELLSGLGYDGEPSLFLIQYVSV